MGRNRKQPLYHAFRKLAHDSVQGHWATDDRYRLAYTWCGQFVPMSEKDRDAPAKLSTCKACAEAIGKAKIKANPRLDLVKRAEPTSGYMRSSYEVLIDGECRAYVSMQNGWGEYWRLYGLKDGEGGYYEHGGALSGERPHRWDAERWPSDRAGPWPVHYAAKEAMAAYAWGLYEAGQLPSLDEMATAKLEAAQRRADEAAQRERDKAQWALERQAKEDVRLERVALWRAALASLLERGDLTNLERAGLDALALLHPYPVDG